MNRLWVRLSLGFSSMVLIAVFLVALAGIVAGRSDRFRPDVPRRLITELADYHRQRQEWRGVETLFRGAQTTLDRRRPDSNVDFFLADANGQVIYHPRERQIGRALDQVRKIKQIPIKVDQTTVGYLGVSTPPRPPPDDDGPGFVEFLGRTLLTVAAVAGGGGVIFGILMSRTLTAPLNRLAEAARAIGARDLSRRVEEKGSAEMVSVARAFNDMAADLEQAEALRRNLLADIAHELRTPLSVVQGNLRAILDEVYPLEQAEIARLYEQTRLLSRLVNDLHELAQAEANQLPLNRQATDLARLIADTADIFLPSAEAEGVTLHTEISSPLPPVTVDAARLQQVLQNLLANALRHTPSGGSITLGAAASDDDGDNEAVRLWVADTGEGIPPDHLPHIFDRFYRADPARSRNRGGTGLGLAIARAIIEAHGGTISVESAGIPGQGSEFTIRLPPGR